MAEKGNGHDAATVQMVAVLERIEGELKGLRVDVTELRGDLILFKNETRGQLTELREDGAATRAEIEAIRNELSGLRVETRAELEELKEAAQGTNERLDNLGLGVAKMRGDIVKLRGGDLERGDYGQRLDKLEDAVFKRTG